MLLLSVGSLGCGSGKSEAVPVLATLGERVVEFDEFMLASRSRTAPGEFPRSGSGFERFRNRLIRDLVVQEVLLGEAEQRGLSVAAEEVEALVAESAAVLDDPKTEAVEVKLLEERYSTPAAHREYLRRSMLISRVEAALREELGEGVELPVEKLDAAVKQHAASLVRVERFHVRQIFVGERKTAQRLLGKLRGGADFEAIAKEQNGANGDMGWMDVDSAPPLLAEASKGLKIGQTSDVQQSSVGYHIFQLLGRQPAEPLDAVAARGEVEKLLRSEATETRFRAWIAARTDELGLVVDDKAVEKLHCCRQGIPYWGQAVGGNDR